MLRSTQLLLTADQFAAGGSAVNYVVLRGANVLAEGQCPLADIPRRGVARASFLSRSAYFDHTEVDFKSAKMLPFQARRAVDAAAAFTEPFRLRFAAGTLHSGRKRLDLVALNASDYDAASEQLPLPTRNFDRLALVENAIASFVALEADEPTAVLWARGSQALGLLVQAGNVVAKVHDRGAFQADTLEIRLERLRSSLQATSRRTYADQELACTLYLGDLAGDATVQLSPDPVCTALMARLGRRFSGARTLPPLQWPEIYGLATVPAAFCLLEVSYRQRALAEKAAVGLSSGMLMASLAGVAVAATNYWELQATKANYEARRTQVEAAYAQLQPRIPSADQLAVVAQSNRIQAGISDFRIDALLAWISASTPHGAIIRRLEIGGAANPGAGAATTAPPPSADLKAVLVEWDLGGAYSEAEGLAFALTERLGEKTKLSNSRLEYASGSPARFATVLTPHPGAFSQ